MFYELMTGRKPFNAENAMDMFMQHVNGTFERPSRLVLDMPVWLDTLICQLLEKKPEQRPLDAAMVAESLGSIQEKVEAQQSAGVDARQAAASSIAPSTQARLDETDKDAARALLGKKKKKKKAGAVLRERLVPGRGHRGRAAGHQCGSLTSRVFKRPSPQSLYTPGRASYGIDDLGRRAEARKGPISDYLDLLSRPPEQTPRRCTNGRTSTDRERGREQSLYCRRMHFKASRTRPRNCPSSGRAGRRGDLGERQTETWGELEPPPGGRSRIREKRPWGLLGRATPERRWPG